MDKSKDVKDAANVMVTDALFSFLESLEPAAEQSSEVLWARRMGDVNDIDSELVSEVGWTMHKAWT